MIPHETEASEPGSVTPSPVEKSYYGGPPLTDPVAVSGCICSRQEVSEAERGMLAEKPRFDDAAKRVEEMRLTLDRARGQIDVNNLDQVNAFRRLSLSYQQAQSDLYDDEVPRYNAMVRRYNAAVAAYNSSCAGRALDPTVVAAVQRTLICRAPQLP